MKVCLKTYLELCKIKVSALSSFSAALGFLLASPELRLETVIPVAGVFLLACGALALNQFQERELDALMPRTSGRPLPSGRLKPANALLFAGALLLAGSITLFSTGGLRACILGLWALFWYNGVYTCLKKKTVFAVLPGAIAGALAPVIGWSTAGGSLSDPRLAALFFFFFIWQIPHSWVVMTFYGREYEAAGIPTVTAIFSRAQIERIILNWLFATALIGFFLSALGFVHYFFIQGMLLIWSLRLLWNGVKTLISKDTELVVFPVLKGINYYLAGVLLLLWADKLLFLS